MDRRMEDKERLVRLEEHVKNNTTDIKEIKDMFTTIHDELLANSVARKILVKGAGVTTMIGGFVMAVWTFVTEFGGTH